MLGELLDGTDLDIGEAGFREAAKRLRQRDTA